MKEVLICVCLATSIWSGIYVNAKLLANLNVLPVPVPSASISTIDAADKCIPTQTCDPDVPYRTFDGSCNNLIFPMWGQAKAALSRLAPADYRDAPQTCCTQGGPKCMNIPVASNDPFYKQFNVTCLPMIRADSTDSIGCSLKPMTEVSHFMDASFVYGSSDQQADRLRKKANGLLSEDLISNQSFPPHSSNPNICFSQTPSDLCMETGDDRANQNSPLAALQVLFFREHNRLATELQKLNPSWNDEKVFQEARKLLIAEYQVIVYRDWLPKIIGQETAITEKLIPNLDLMSDDYDQFFNPSTTNDFTSAAYRVFHSQIPDAYCAKDKPDKAKGCPFGAINFSRTLENPSILTSLEGFQSVLFGLDRQNAEKTDNTFSKEIAGRLFRRNRPWGLDLVATDIARGRDVGLPSYNTYRSLCGLRPAKVWTQLVDVFNLKALRKLRSLYEDPDDIDLYVAGVLERKFRGSLVGPIFQCIIVDQFKRWMKGDRYFVDFKGFKHSFNKDQAKALKATSLARIFCDNGGNVPDLPKDIFLLGSERVPCNKIPHVDLSPWKES